MLAAGYQVVARTLGRRCRENWRLKLKEAHFLHFIAQKANNLRAQNNVVVHFLVAQIEITVLQTNVLAGFAGSLDFKRELLGNLAKYSYFFRFNLDCTGFDFIVKGALIALQNRSRNRNGALLVNALKQALVVKNNLHNAVMVAKVNEHNSAVVADILNPTRRANLFSYVIFTETVAVSGSVFIFHKQFNSALSLYFNNLLYHFIPHLSS